MRQKRILSLILAVACLAVLLVSPSTAASSAVSTFPDIRDDHLGEAVEALRTMGVIDGLPGGDYNPNGTLTRAEFCKLAVTVMGLSDQVAAQATRTVFSDVTGTYWARGYINLASAQVVDAKADTRLIVGVGDGTFRPSRPITFGEAVTILLRVLGYTTEANVSWPQGAISTAQTIGLTDGLPPLTGSSAITRGQAALLFYNLLLTSPKGSSGIYAASRGSVTTDVLLLDCDTTAADGTSGAVQISGKSAVLPAVKNPAAFFQGKSGTAVFDDTGRFLTFLPERGSTNSAVISAGASASGLTLSNGTVLSLSASTPVWRGSERSTYGDTWTTLDRSGIPLMVYYTAAGAVDYLYVNTTSSSGGAMVNLTQSKGNPFLPLIGDDTGYTIYKNGSRATSSDIRQYDVATYDPATRSLFISDLRLSGVYEDAIPNRSAPTKVRLLGAEFDVLESAWDTLRDLQPGSPITLLFTVDGMVAGAVPIAACRSNAVGIASISGNSATVQLLDSSLPPLTGTVSNSNVGFLDGQLVSVGYGSSGSLSISRLTSSQTPGSLDVLGRKIGLIDLADNVHIYDRVGKSALVEVSWEDLPLARVPAADITYVRTNYAGKVDLIVLEDVTGEVYEYGKISVTRSELPILDDQGNPTGDSASRFTQHFINSKGTGLTIETGNSTFAGGEFVGWVTAFTADGANKVLARSFALQATSSFVRSAYDPESNSITAGNITLPLSDDLQCYNNRNGRWSTNLEDFLSSAASFVAYYDRDPDEGGKIRILSTR